NAARNGRPRMAIVILLYGMSSTFGTNTFGSIAGSHRRGANRRHRRCEQDAAAPYGRLRGAAGSAKLPWTALIGRRRHHEVIMSDMNAVMRPPRRILLATDLASQTDRALDRAVRLARQWQAQLHVVHALPPDAPNTWLPYTYSDVSHSA